MSLSLAPRHRPPRAAAAAAPTPSLTQGSSWTRRPATWDRRWWAARSCTGGPTTAGNAGAGVALLCPRSPFSHVVAYRRSDSALHGAVDTLLDAASYGTRWVLLSPAESSGVSRLRPRPSPAGA